MKTLLFLVAVALNVACIFAAPCLPSPPGPCKPSPPTCSASCYQFFRYEYSVEFKVEYCAVDYCAKWGIAKLPYLPKILYEDIEYKFYSALCEWLAGYKYWPTFINPLECSCYDYDYIFIDINVSTLFLLEKLVAQGYKVAIISSALAPPVISKSLYFNYAFYKSQYMRTISFKSSVLKVQKSVAVPNILGGFMSLYGVDFDIGVQEVYSDLAKIDSLYAWEKVEAAYKKFQYSETKTETKTEVDVSSCGKISYRTYTRQTTSTKCVSSWFEECGYKLSSGIMRSQGLCKIPWIGDDFRPYNFLDYMFRRIKNINNVHLISGYNINKLIIENGLVTGVEIDTLTKKMVFKAKKEVIIASSTITMLELLYKSGCGPKEVLTPLGYPVLVPMPYLGVDLVVPNYFAGLCLKFPKGAFIDYAEDDYNAFGVLFGEDFSTTAALYAQKAYFSVAGCKYTNLKVEFHAFTCCMLKRAEMYFRNVFYYSEETVLYMLDMIKNYDIVVLNFEQLDMRSRGYFKYVNKMSTLEYEMYSNKYDFEVMSECFKIAQKIATATSFTSIGGSLVPIPVPGCKFDLYSTEFIRESLYYFSYAGSNVWGGALMGADIKTSVINTKFAFNSIKNLRILNRSIFKSTYSSFNFPLMMYIGQQSYDIIINSSSSSVVSSSSTTVIEGRDCCGPCDLPCGPVDLPCGPGDLPCGPGDLPCGPGGIPLGPGPEILPCGPCGPELPVPCGPCGPELPGPCGPCGPELPGPCGPCGPELPGPCGSEYVSESMANEILSESAASEFMSGGAAYGKSVEEFAAGSSSYSKDVAASSYDIDQMTCMDGCVSSMSAEGSSYSEKTEEASSYMSGTKIC